MTMISKKEIRLHVNKPMNYLPIKRSERLRVIREVARNILDVASRFDGDSKLTIKITAKGNA